MSLHLKQQILQPLVINYGWLCQILTELHVYVLSLSRSLVIGSSNWLLITLYGGVPNGAYSALDSHGVASDHFQWSRSLSVDFRMYLWITLPDGHYECYTHEAFQSNGVACYVYSGRGVCT